VVAPAKPAPPANDGRAALVVEIARRPPIVWLMENVLNGEVLTEIFGYWPSFHDAEVVQIRLDRGQADAQTPPVKLEADVHVFEMTDRLTAEGTYELQKHTLVTLAFRGLAQLQLKWFNHQNVLCELGLCEISDHRDGLKWEVSFDSAYGVDASFLCKEVEVLRAAPFESRDDHPEGPMRGSARPLSLGDSPVE
jgi:hypothetical protein